MQYRTGIPIIVVLCMAIVFAGCTGSQGSSGTSATTSGPGTYAGSPAAENSLVTSPVDTIPQQNMVTVDIGEKDYLGNIPVIFQGGMGQIHVKKIDVTLYRSDGQARTTTIGVNKGDSAELEGTKQTDRVVVYITFDNGQRLKTNDVQSPYRTRGN